MVARIRFSERTTVCAITGGNPDGVAVDDDGAVWVAVWGAGEVRRHATDGRLLDVVTVSTSLPSAVALCGHTLVITTAHDGEAGGGLLHVLDVPTPGPAAVPFAAEPHVLYRNQAALAR